MIPRSERGGDRLDKYDTKEQAFLKQLATDFENFRFVKGARFAFRPPRTIAIGPPEPNWRLLLLHEVGHAVLGHRNFGVDIERLKMEAMAWEKARELAARYNLGFDEEVAQRELDTYRDWLHKKSRCPKCGLTRFQTPDLKYCCPRCDKLLSNKK